MEWRRRGQGSRAHCALLWAWPQDWTRLVAPYCRWRPGICLYGGQSVGCTSAAGCSHQRDAFRYGTVSDLGLHRQCLCVSFLRQRAVKCKGSLLRLLTVILNRTTCKDKKLRLFDPRAGAAAVTIADSHSGVKGSRVQWLGSLDRIVTTGFSRTSDRQCYLWDSRNLTSGPIKTMGIDQSSGMLMPFWNAGNK